MVQNPVFSCEEAALEVQMSLCLCPCVCYQVEIQPVIRGMYRDHFFSEEAAIKERVFLSVCWTLYQIIS